MTDKIMHYIAINAFIDWMIYTSGKMECEKILTVKILHQFKTFRHACNAHLLKRVLTDFTSGSLHANKY